MNCDPTTEKTDAGTLSETDAGVPFIANLPHTSKHYDCVILSKTDSIGCYTPTLYLPSKLIRLRLNLSLIHI